MHSIPASAALRSGLSGEIGAIGSARVAEGSKRQTVLGGVRVSRSLGQDLDGSGVIPQFKMENAKLWPGLSLLEFAGGADVVEFVPAPKRESSVK